ncbi:MAG: helix-turn-helix transcriptional regulator [Proteobacteria bacterium]|nr:helix-turn-helix transcriptional regulator [Pseudomonadota bacterium]
MKLAQQIEARMKAQNISIMGLENKAGLKPHAVRNILTGKSKRPSAINLQAIADTLGCSVKDLLSEPPIVQEKPAGFSRDDILEMKYAEFSNYNLIHEVVKTVDSLLRRKDVTTEQFFVCLKEVYLQSLQKDPNTVDQEFARWFVDLMVK